MGRKLNTYVHVDGEAYGPDDDLPDEVAARITNPDVWADGDPGGEQSASGGSNSQPLAEPPRGGAGSGYDAWAAYARQEGVEVTGDMSREDIMAAVDAAKG